MNDKNALCKTIQSALPDVEVVKDWGYDSATGWPFSKVHFSKRPETQRRIDEAAAKKWSDPKGYVFENAALSWSGDVVNVLETPTPELAAAKAADSPEDDYQAAFAWRNFWLWGDKIRLEQIRKVLGIE